MATSEKSRSMTEKIAQNIEEREFDARTFSPVDLFGNMEPKVDDNDGALIFIENNNASKSRWSSFLFLWRSSIYPWLVRSEFLMWGYLILLGIISGLVLNSADRAVYGLQCLIREATNTGFLGVNLLLWILFATLFALLSHVVILFVSLDAAGSGIPEMKTMLSGVSNENFLSFKTLIAKTFSLILALASGLFIGKEGPFVHIASCIAEQLMRIPFFRRYEMNEVVHTQLLSIGSAVGVSASFSSPIGGVLFSVEVLSSFYLVDSLWKGLLGAVVGYFTAYLLPNFESIQQTFLDFEDDVAYNSGEIPLFIAFGLLCGLLALLWVRLHRLAQHFDRWFLSNIRAPFNGIIKVTLVALLMSPLTYFFPLLRSDTRFIKEVLLQPQPFSSGSEWTTLIGTFFWKFFISILCVVFCRVAAGVFIPSIVIGMAFGRIFGELLYLIPLFHSSKVIPVVYSIIGGLGVAAGTTQTISPAMIMIELTGKIELLVPSLLVALLSDVVCRLFSPSAYENVIEMRKLPMMTSIRNSNLLLDPASMSAFEFMDTKLRFLTLDSTYNNVFEVLQHYSHSSLPVVENKDNMVFVGIVTVDSLHDLLTEKGIRPPLSGKMKNENFVDFSMTESASFRTKPSNSEYFQLDFDNFEETESFLYDRDEIPLSLKDEKIPFAFTSNVNLISKKGKKKQIISTDGIALITTQALTITKDYSLSKTYFLFTMLGLSYVFVLSRSRLVGVVTKRSLLDIVKRLCS